MAYAAGAPTGPVAAGAVRLAAGRCRDDEAAGRKPSALWNLERAVALTPGDWTLYALRANLARLGPRGRR